MGTISAKKLTTSLSKARNVGIIEDSFVLEGCELTIRNLRSDEYIAVINACSGLDSYEYLRAFHKHNLARAIVEVNGADLREVDFVEDEEQDPKHPETIRKIKLEVHDYLFKTLISTWSQEAVHTAFRKFSDLIEKAERRAKDGITFLVPDETDEDKYRRLLLEAKELEVEIPDSLVDTVLDGVGLMRKSTADEIKAAMERTDRLAREDAAKVTASVEPEPAPAPEPESAPRQPLNRAVGVAVPDPHQTLQQAIAARRVPVTEPVEDLSPTSLPTRSAAIAALEPDFLPGAQPQTPDFLPDSQGNLIPVHRTHGTDEVVEIRRQEAFDPNAAKTILDKPPNAGINPRFKPQNKT